MQMSKAKNASHICTASTAAAEYPKAKTTNRRLHKIFDEQDTMTPTTVTQRVTDQVSDKTSIRPFHVNVPEAELTELRRRIDATKWPERETATDATQGVQLATVQALARYWATEYDWRKIEAKLNALPLPRSTAWTFISSMSVRNTKMRCR
jgi:hypothetical protein